MFFRILKKDLKRKKTMNVILLLFVVLAAMFVASSVNNIITVTNGLDYYFISEAMFAEKVAAGEFLEHVRYGNYRYGTLKSEVSRINEKGNIVIFDVDILSVPFNLSEE